MILKPYIMNRTIFISLAVIFIVSVITLATLVGRRTGPEQKFQIKKDENTVLVSITPWGDPLQVKNAYKPLFQYLSKKTGKKFQPLVMEDYDVAINNIAEGSTDISIIPPVSYVKARMLEPGIQYIATLERLQGSRMSATYKGHLIALRSRYGGLTLDDFLKNAKDINIGFVTKSSSSGWAYPMAMLKKRGVDPYKAFKSVTVFDNHPLLTDAIVAGKVDLGATWEYNLETAKEKHGDIFTVIYTTEDIPGLSWVASKETDPQLVKKIHGAMMEINRSDELKKKLLQDTPDKGWTIVDEKTYDVVREVLNYVKDFH